jgi:hypothetical protein
MLALIGHILFRQSGELLKFAEHVIHVDRFEIDANDGECLLVEERGDGLRDCTAIRRAVGSAKRQCESQN